MTKISANYLLNDVTGYDMELIEQLAYNLFVFESQMSAKFFLDLVRVGFNDRNN